MGRGFYSEQARYIVYHWSVVFGCSLTKEYEAYLHRYIARLYAKDTNRYYHCELFKKGWNSLARREGFITSTISVKINDGTPDERDFNMLDEWRKKRFQGYFSELRPHTRKLTKVILFEEMSNVRGEVVSSEIKQSLEEK